MPRGGRRQGRQGKAYSNRTDLNQKPSIARIPGQTYGKQAEQVQAQQMVPAGPPPTQPPAPQRPQPQGGQGGPSPADGLIPLDAPTQIPGEDVFTGAPVGPGAGPEALMRSPVQRPSPQEEDLTDFLPYLPTLELIASQPFSSASTRNLVRRLRAAILVPKVPTLPGFTDNQLGGMGAPMAQAPTPRGPTAVPIPSPEASPPEPTQPEAPAGLV